MIKDVLSVFERKYEQRGDRLITDNYQIGEGTYVVLSLTEGIKQIYEVTREVDTTDDLYNYFAIRDYYSKLLDMNKSIDNKKIIHSNQIYSFFVKKESLQQKLTPEVIENYYKVLQNPRYKYTEKKKLAMYEEAELQYGNVKIDEVTRIKQCIIQYLPIIQHQMKEDKNYLKIFIEADVECYIREAGKYVIPNIYNSSEFNVVVEDILHGLPNNNIGLNAKKPFLENKQQKTTVPTLLSIDEVMKQKLLFDYLMNYAEQGKRNLFIEMGSHSRITALKNDEMPKQFFTGYFLRIQKGKELEIHDFDTVHAYNPKLHFELKNVLDYEFNPKYNENINYKSYSKLEDIQVMINEYFFKKFLTTNYFTDSKDIKIKDNYLKYNLLRSRSAWFNWFYKGSTKQIETMLDETAIAVIKGTILVDEVYRARQQFNIYYSLKAYLEQGVEKMADILSAVKYQLREKIKLDHTVQFESNEEYYFAVGQIVFYLLYQNRSNSKTDALLNPIINCSQPKILNQQLVSLYRKYNYSIQGNKKFRNLFAMLLSYVPTTRKVNTTSIIAGYLHSNLLLEKHSQQEEEQ